jgi:hypothetical protein
MKYPIFTTRVRIIETPLVSSRNDSLRNYHRRELQKAINMDKIFINRNVFSKNDSERIKLKNAKAEWKKHQ